MTPLQLLGGAVSKDLLNAALRNPHLQSVARKHGVDLGDAGSVQRLVAAAGLKVRDKDADHSGADADTSASRVAPKKLGPLGLYTAIAAMR